MRMRQSKSERSRGCSSRFAVRSSRFAVRSSWFAVRGSRFAVRRDQSCLFCFPVWSGFTPDAMSTVNGSPERRAPVVTLMSIRPAFVKISFNPAGEKPSHRSPRRSRTQDCSVLPQIEHESAAARRENTNGLSHHARRIFGMMQRLRQQGDVNAAVVNR